jgi:uncharacterized protein (TIGR02246 family)
MKYWLAAMAMTILAGCAAPDTHDADVKGVKDNEVQWNKDYASKDLDKIVAHYSDDATLMANGMAAASGKDAIRALVKEMLTDPALSLKFDAARVEVAKSGEMAYTQGSYTMTMTNPATKQPMDDKGSYVTTYRKQADGTWKALYDINASSIPPGPPAPASAAK